MKKEDFEFYVSKHKEHEENKVSTNDRQEFWKQWTKLNKLKDSQE